MRYRILGPLGIEDGPVPTRGQQARLLGAFLLDPGRILSNAHLAEWVLGEERRHDGAQVHVLVARLRRELRERAMPGIIHTGSTGYCFEVDVDACDQHAFDALMQRASALRHTDLHGSREALAAGIDLWRGDVLAGDGFESHPVVRRLSDCYADAIEDEFLIDLELGDLVGSLSRVVAASRQRPERERLRVLAMVALHQAGRQTEALALFHEARLRLSALGIDPGEALVDAEVDVLRHDLKRTILRLLPNLGHVSAPTFRTANIAERPVRGAPRFGSSFVGRALLLRQVGAELAAPGLVTVFGPGGVGKTRTVCEVLATLDPTRVNTFGFAELATLPEDLGLSQFLASALGVRVPAGREPLDVLTDWLREGRGVLVLDSCEAAPVAQLAEHLLRQCPLLTLVATSRSLIGLPGERVIDHPPMPSTEGLELYGHRALDTDNTFRLDADGASVVEQLCDRLDGLPLAVELAAARVKTVTASELLHFFDERFAVLTSDRPGPHRHRSLEATVAWSYGLLDETQQQMLRRLAIFAGPVDVAAIESIWVDRSTDRMAILKALTELVDRSMVATARHGQTTRYRLLETIRTFALDRAKERGDLDDMRRHHAEHFARRAAAIRLDLRSDCEASAVSLLDACWSELRAAVAWCISADEPSIAIRLVAGFGFEAVFRERRELESWTEQILVLPGVLECLGADELLATSAMADWGFGHFDRGWSRAQQAIELHRDRGTAPTPDLLAAFPLHESMRGDVVGGLSTLRAHEREALVAQVPFSEAHLLCCQAMAYAYLGISDDGVSSLARASAIATSLGNPLLQTIVAFTRAIEVLDADPAASVVFAEKSLQLAASVRATWFETASVNYLTAAQARVGDLDGAVRQLQETLDRLLRGSALQSAANTLRNSVVVLDRLGVPERAARIVGWLEGNRTAIPGTPGMRNHPSLVAEQLRRDLGVTHADDVIDAGSRLTLEQIMVVAQQELADAVSRLNS